MSIDPKLMFAESEVARLREAYDIALAECAWLLKERDRWETEADRLSCGWQNERAAHEATKAELELMIAEQEGVITCLNSDIAGALADRKSLEAALDQARGLLDSAAGVVQWQGWHDDYAAWLSANHATVSPSSDLVVTSETSFAPAATGEYHAHGDVPAGVLAVVRAAYYAAKGVSACPSCEQWPCVCTPLAAKEAKGD